VVFVAALTAYAGPRAVRVADGHFVDANGRQVMLHGVNMGEKSGNRGYIGGETPEDFAKLHEWGMNCVRFLIFWDGVEPQPGVYDDAYLDRVAERAAWAREAGVWLILDMHQDLFGPGIPGGDGAPKWATITEGQPHGSVPGAWASAYTCSRRLQKAFDNFYNNAPGPDGVGLRDHFAAAWRHVAERFKDEPAVIGDDLLNEPAMGERIRGTAVDVWRAAPELVGQVSKPGGINALMKELESGGTPPEWLLDALDDRARYVKLLDVLAPHLRAFEATQLGPLQQCTANAIRQADSEGILFIVSGGLANIGVPVDIPVIRRADGSPDPQQAYYPHVYDLVTDTPLAYRASASRLAVMFDRIEDYASKNGLPVAIGEWGGYYGSEKTRPTARRVLCELEKHGYGDFYWSYHDHFDRASYFEMLCRPYPMAVAGVLTSYGTDPETHTFTCAWTSGEGKAATDFYLPAKWYPKGYEVDVVPRDARQEFSARGGDGAGVLHITVDGAGNACSVSIRPKE
jgi:endoglycosylceramidase